MEAQSQHRGRGTEGSPPPPAPAAELCWAVCVGNPGRGDPGQARRNPARLCLHPVWFGFACALPKPRAAGCFVHRKEALSLLKMPFPKGSCGRNSSAEQTRPNLRLDRSRLDSVSLGEHLPHPYRVPWNPWSPGAGRFGSSHHTAPSNQGGRLRGLERYQVSSGGQASVRGCGSVFSPEPPLR